MRTIKELMSLEGKTALVTGGAGHIGAAICSAFAEAGAKIAIVDRELAALEVIGQALGRESATQIACYPIDLADEAAVAALPATVAADCGSLDILVNCAAFVGTSKLDGWAVPFESQLVSTWRAAFEVNVTAPFGLIQAAVPFLKRSGKGSVINISSIYGMLGPDWRLYEGTTMGNPAAYGASKAALEQLTRWLATTLSPEVRVNCITPGGVWRNQPASFVERYSAGTPLGRMAQEEDFKGAALFLASELSAYVTGHNLVVDGGWSTK